MFLDENIGYSRDGDFFNMVMNKTNGQGCGIVVSCVQGELKTVRATISLFGVFNFYTD